MYIETLDHSRVLVEISRSELDSYGVEFRRMTLADSHTRLMLNDMLSAIGSMGIWEQGDRVTIECAQSIQGGCTLVFEINGKQRFYFACCDDMISAAIAGALPDEYDIERQGEQCTVIAHSAVPPARAALLREFIAPPPEL